MSLAHAYFRLDEFKAGPISAAYLLEVEQRFAEARAGGIKIVPRFAYNFPAGLPLKPGDEDAPLPIVLEHIGQLQPILRRNSDVIAYMEAGFVGAWGEWHHSTNNLDSVAAERAILLRLLQALPRDRFVAVRYLRDKEAIFHRSTPATLDEILRGTDYGRIAHHNDCFLASSDDWDTYRPKDAKSIAAQKARLAAENELVPQGGETCNVGKDAQPFIHCKTALPELERQHWSQLNADFHAQVYELWRKEGCYGEIARRLGYRLRLVSASFPRRIAASGRISGSMLIANDGFAAPYNRRDVELVLRSRATGRVTHVRLAADPRRWTGGGEHRVSIATVVPRGLQSGSYELLLNLPDPAATIHNRPEYAIRLANAGTWEPETGYNRLLITVNVRR